MTCTHLLKMQLASPSDTEVLRIMRPVYCDDQHTGHAIYRGDTPGIQIPDPTISLLRATHTEAEIRDMIQNEQSFYEIADRLRQIASTNGTQSDISSVNALIESIDSSQEIGTRLFPKEKGRFRGISMPSQPSQPFMKIGLVQLNTAVSGVADLYIWKHELPSSLMPGTEILWPPREPNAKRIGFLMQVVQSGSENLPYRLRICVDPQSQSKRC